MAVISSSCKKLTGDLIKSLTDCQPDDENYRRCYEFCMSNFKYHTFLSIDSHKVQRQLTNLSTKFKVHSYPERAEKLDSLVETFLHLSLFKSYSHSDAHYSILHCLLCLAHSPTNVYYKVSQEPHPQDMPPKDEAINWYELLMGGVVFPSYDESSSSDSEFVALSDDEILLDETTSHDSAIDVSCTDEGLGMRPRTPHAYVPRPYWTSYRPAHSQVMINESQVVRETLWILLGAESSFIYSFKDGSYTVQSNVNIFHMTQKSLDDTLNHFAHFATELMSLRGVAMATHETTQTSQAYSNALMCYISGVDDKLREIEETVSKKRDFVSLLKLHHDLNDIFIEVSCIAEIGTTTDSKELLDRLWSLLLSYDTMGIAGMRLVKIVFPLFVMSLCPYLTALSKWMTTGTLHDPMEELFIQYNTDSVLGSSTYWNECYKCSSPPRCFQDISHQILIAGKSCHLTTELNGMSNNEQSHDSIYTQFLSYFISEDKRLEPVVVKETHPGDDFSLVLFTADPILRESLLHLTQESLTLTDNSRQLYCHLEEIAPDVCTSNGIIQSVTSYISTSINTLLSNQFNQSSKYLTDLLKTDYNLLQHFDNLQNILLTASGDAIHHFSTMLFHKVNTGEPVTESGFITNMLHDSLQERHSHLIKLFSVNLSGPITAAMQSFANITMCYEVPWPVNLIFPDSILHTYNSVFIFLFQLKYSRWNLDQSWLIIRRCTDTTNVLVHKVLLLRAKLLQFVISVNHYILTRILHSSGLEFQDKVTSCDSMDTLLSMHCQYIATVHDRCLLNQKAQYVKEAVVKILLLVVRFYHKCLNMDEFSFNDGQFFEDEFSKCIRFLITYLKNHIKRGSYPHLETLCFSLSSLLSGASIFNTNR